MGWLVVFVTAAMLTCAAGGLIKVGDGNGWTQNYNYTQWAANHTFYVGDWLYFVFDKHQYTVFEVNRTSYNNCNDIGFITNITRGGRDVFNLTEVRPYYFLSGGGYCYNGMKLDIDVEEPPPPPIVAPSSAKKNGSSPEGNGKKIFVSLLLLVVALVVGFSF